MTTSGFDAIGAVENLYRTDLSSVDWLSLTAASLQPLLDPEHDGMIPGLYRCVDPISFAPGLLTFEGCSDRLVSVFLRGLTSVSPALVADCLLVAGIVRCAGLPGWTDHPPVRDGSLKELGFVDALSLVAVEPDGSGLCFEVFKRQPAVLAGAEKPLIQSIYRHLLAAHRVQRGLQGRPTSPATASAVLDPNGRVHHATGAIRDAEARQALAHAVRSSEQSRGARRRQDPLGALSAWQSLVMGRWTLVDHFDTDGRRYILALENAAASPGKELLSEREMQVVECALRGLHNKAIAHELGLAHSTVKVLMMRAATKLGVRTRREVLARLRS